MNHTKEDEPPTIRAWFNNIAVILISGFFSFLITIFTLGRATGQMQLQVEINTHRLDRLEGMDLAAKFATLSAADSAIKQEYERQLVSVQRQQEEINRKLDRLLDNHIK